MDSAAPRPAAHSANTRARKWFGGLEPTTLKPAAPKRPRRLLRHQARTPCTHCNRCLERQPLYALLRLGLLEGHLLCGGGVCSTCLPVYEDVTC